jgi:hypothetical protein
VPLFAGTNAIDGILFRDFGEEGTHKAHVYAHQGCTLSTHLVSSDYTVRISCPRHCVNKTVALGRSDGRAKWTTLQGCADVAPVPLTAESTDYMSLAPALMLEPAGRITVVSVGDVLGATLGAIIPSAVPAANPAFLFVAACLVIAYGIAKIILSRRSTRCLSTRHVAAVSLEPRAAYERAVAAQSGETNASARVDKACVDSTLEAFSLLAQEALAIPVASAASSPSVTVGVVDDASGAFLLSLPPALVSNSDSARRADVAVAAALRKLGSFHALVPPVERGHNGGGVAVFHPHVDVLSSRLSHADWRGVHSPGLLTSGRSSSLLSGNARSQRKSWISRLRKDAVPGGTRTTAAPVAVHALVQLMQRCGTPAYDSEVLRLRKNASRSHLLRRVVRPGSADETSSQCVVRSVPVSQSAVHVPATSLPVDAVGGRGREDLALMSSAATVASKACARPPACVTASCAASQSLRDRATNDPAPHDASTSMSSPSTSVAAVLSSSAAAKTNLSAMLALRSPLGKSIAAEAFPPAPLCKRGSSSPQTQSDLCIGADLPPCEPSSDFSWDVFPSAVSPAALQVAARMLRNGVPRDAVAQKLLRDGVENATGVAVLVASNLEAVLRAVLPSPPEGGESGSPGRRL